MESEAQHLESSGPPGGPDGPGWTGEGLQLLGVVLLTVYGIEVCPFLSQLEHAELGVVLLVSFALVTPVRRHLVATLEAEDNAALLACTSRWPWRHGLLELGAWLATGLLMSLWNLKWYGFPVVLSGFKLVAGSLILGILAGAHALMDRQTRVLAWYRLHPGLQVHGEGRPMPIATQLFVFFAAELTVFATVLVLLFKKDAGALIRAARSGEAMAFHAEVTAEVAFVTVVLLAGMLLLARQFGRNLEGMFELELRALRAVEDGRYDCPVPLVSHDEFRTVAASTNRMIDGLRERDRIRNLFGRYLSPSVAASILETEGGEQLGGRQVDVAVLFSDLRNFTPLSERLAPRELVSFLNEYLGEMVGEITRCDGVVDKFIGDAVMAVFGLDGHEDACGRSLEAALGMRGRLAELNERLASRGLPAVDNGIGIHFGPVIAGNIGSADRLEYTVIGDSVNLASRLESATKDLGVAVAISAEVRGRLSTAQRGPLRDLGAHLLKGKAHPVQVYGV